MSIESCETMRLVEARYDGRLGDREAASLDRHVATCAACRAHAADLPRLREIAGESIEPQTPLQQQRARAKLLYEAARIDDPRGGAPSRPRWATGLVFAAAMFAAAFLGWTLRAPQTAPSEPARAAVVLSAPIASASAKERLATTVAPERGARFAQRSADGAETVTLDEGAATFAVRPLSASERFIIKTADGEIELRGAVARVEASASKVRSVAVTEGKAEVRYGGAIFELNAGSTWSPPLEAATPSAAPSAPAAPTSDPRLGRASVHAPNTSVVASRSAPKPAEPVAAAPSAPEPPAPAAAPPEPPKADPGATAFADAVHLFERGDYPSAARHLADFSKAHPEDGRAEDAAFLGILSLQRTGKTAEAAAAARRYLQTYPAGYRRVEAAKIAEKR